MSIYRAFHSLRVLISSLGWGEILRSSSLMGMITVLQVQHLVGQSELKSSKHMNEPAGFVEITDRAFSDRKEGGWKNRGDKNFEIISDSTAPASPPFVGRAYYPAGFQAGRGPINTWLDLDPKYSKLYVSFWLKLSENWSGNQAGVN